MAPIIKAPIRRDRIRIINGPFGWVDHRLVRFYNPRVDLWAEHFALDGSSIQARSDIGDVTVRILGFNLPERLKERDLLREIGRFPPDDALDLLVGES
jgi:hypothetical protein